VDACFVVDDQEFLVLERNNRSLGVDATLASPNKKVVFARVSAELPSQDTSFSCERPGGNFRRRSNGSSANELHRPALEQR